MSVEQIMTRGVATVDESDTVFTAAGLMAEHGCRALPVVDDDGAVVGMVSDRDICFAAAAARKRLHEIGITNVVNGDPATVRPSATVEATLEMMRDQGVLRVVVVDEARRPVGMVTIRDLARHWRAGDLGTEAAERVADMLTAVGEATASGRESDRAAVR